jgi:hypothetical protein
MNIGDKITLIPSVNADAGLATTVTWASSDATKATVDGSGVVTAVAATPGVAVCATSTVDTGKKGCASIVVTAATATIPATVTIAGITTGNLNTPVVPTAVVGVINVQANVNTGNQTVQRVVLRIDNIRVDSQVISAAQSAALRSAADEAIAAQANLPTIVFTSNTAAFNPTTGVPTFLNGVHAVAVELWTKTGTAAPVLSSTATFASTLTYANVDAIAGTVTMPTTLKNAVDAAGYQWTSLGGGALQISALPVAYSGKTVSSVSINFNPTGGVGTNCYLQPAGYIGNAPGNVGNVLPASSDTVTRKTIAAAPYNFSFSLSDMEYNTVAQPANCPIAAPTTPAAILAYTDGSASNGALNFTNVAALTRRWDNKGPAAPALTVPTYNPSLTAVRGIVSLTSIRPTLTSLSPLADSAKAITAFPADAGVSAGANITGGVIDSRGITFSAIRGNAAATVTDSTLPGTTPITTADLSSLTEGRYCIRVIATDALGNNSNGPAQSVVNAAGTVVARGCQTGSGQIQTVVDNTAPVLAFSTAGFNYSQVDTVIAGNVAGLNYFWSTTDATATNDSVRVQQFTNATGSTVLTCPIGVRGSAATAPLTRDSVNVGGVAQAGAAVAAFCPYVITPAASSGVRNVDNVISSTQTNSFSGVTVNNAQYVITVKSVDAAGNQSTTNLVRVIAADNTAPTAPTTPANIVSTLGSAVTLSSFATDNLSISRSAGFVTPTAVVATITTANRIMTADFATQEAVNVTPYAKFLNVAIAQSLSAALSPAYIFLSDVVSSLIGNTQWQSARSTWGMEVADQPGTTAISAANGTTLYADTVGVINTVSGFAGITGGLDYTPTIASAFTTVASTNSALAGTAATQAANPGTVLNATFIQKITSWDKVSTDEAAFLGGDAFRTTSYCNTARNAANILVSGAQSATSTSNAAANSAPTVTALAKTTTNLLVAVGTASLVANDITGGTATPNNACDDLRTRTYSFTFTPGRRTLYGFNPGAAGGGAGIYFLYTFPKGQAILGPQMHFTYVP